MHSYRLLWKKILVSLTMVQCFIWPTEATTAFVGKDPAKAKMAKDFISHVNSTAEEGAGLSKGQVFCGCFLHGVGVG